MYFDLKVTAQDVAETQQRAEFALADINDPTNETWLLPKDADDATRAKVERIRQAEMERAEAALHPVNADRLHLPQLPLVRLASNLANDESYAVLRDRTFVLMGEIAQMEGHVMVIDVRTREIIPIIHSCDLEMIPTSEA